MGNRSSRPGNASPGPSRLPTDGFYKDCPSSKEHPYDRHPPGDRPSSFDGLYNHRKSASVAQEAAALALESAPRPKVTVTTNKVSIDAEIVGLRQQIIGNANCLFPSRNLLEVVVMSAEYPENGWYAARLIDICDCEVLAGKTYSDSIPKALRELLQETCDDIRDTYVLQNYRTHIPR